MQKFDSLFVAHASVQFEKNYKVHSVTTCPLSFISATLVLVKASKTKTTSCPCTKRGRSRDWHLIVALMEGNQTQWLLLIIEGSGLSIT